MTPDELESLSRDQLIERAESLGVERASVLTRSELADEIVRRTVVDPVERRRARGLLGVARDLLARVVERGLHLPEAAALIRGPAKPRPTWPRPKAPLATVTLAEIYAAQGHRARSLAVLDEVLANEPDHDAARALRDRLARGPELSPVMPAEPDEPEASADAGAEGADMGLGERARSVGTSPMAESAAPSTQPALRATDAGSKERPFQRVGMLDDAPLPERYDVDEVVAMPVDPTTIYLYWEARETTLAEAAGRAAAGTLLVRLVAVSPSWHGPKTETRDFVSSSAVGDAFVGNLPAGAVIRVALGWQHGASFEPFVIAPELMSPVERRSPFAATELGRFTPEGVRSATDRDAEGDPALVRALSRYRARAEAAAAAGRAWPPEASPVKALGSSHAALPR